MAEPFEPRFVDLVRNYTTTVGTGNLVLGQAVSGFTSFASAVQPGDQFYYSAIGVDKPNEREVGRGTMQANGSIAREAIGGSLTSFSNGTKTVALIAAAEWFEKIEAGGGSSGGSAQAATRTALAALPTPGAALLTEPGREGLFVFDSSNLSAKVAADTRQGIYVAPGSDASGTSGAWVRRFSGPADLRWFGAIPDDNGTSGTDNLAAVNGALAALEARSIGYNDGALRQFCEDLLIDGWFYVGAPIEVKQSVNLVGVGSGNAKHQRSRLRFPANSDGIRLQAGNTLGLGTEGVSTGAAGGNIRGLMLQGGGGTGGHGIRMRATSLVEDFWIENFGGDGIHIDTGAGAGGESEGNANCFRLLNGVCHANGRHGVFVSGAGNGNAGTGIGLSCTFNAASGIHDASFLGNTWVGCHTEANGLRNWVPGATKNGALCNHGGSGYACRIGQEAAASTTTPGTNSAIWYPISPSGPFTFAPAWTSGQQWQSGGAYVAGNVNAFAMFIGCYAESGQAPCQDESGRTFAYGQLASGYLGAGRITRGDANRWVFGAGLETTDGNLIAAKSLVWKGLEAPGGGTACGLGYVNGGQVNIEAYGGGYPAFSSLNFNALDINFVRANSAIATVDANGINLAAGKSFRINGVAIGELANGDKGDVIVSGGGSSLVVESASPADGSFEVAGGVKLSADFGGFLGAGSMYTSATGGLILVAKAGSVADVGFYTPGGAAIFNVPTGTADVNYFGDLLLNSGKVVRVNGTQVLGARKTGWSAATGTATRTAFDTASVTTAQLAQRVKGLIDDLISHGAIGA